MNLLTTDEEHCVRIRQLRKVPRVEKIIFPILVACLTPLLLSDVAPLLYMPMLGNLSRERGTVERLSDATRSALYNVCTIFLNLPVGATAHDRLFLRPQALATIVTDPAVFSFSILDGVVLNKVLYTITDGKISPLIGSAGASAALIAARVSQTIGSKMDRANFLLMHTVGPNVTDVINSAVATRFFLTFFAH